MLVRGQAVRWGTTEVLEGALWLEGRAVGRVKLCGRDGPWHFGRFLAGPAFAPFASTFAAWSRLMDDDGDAHLRDAQRAKLARLERAIDQWRAWIVAADNSLHAVRQLNIDGGLIEWKE